MEAPMKYHRHKVMNHLAVYTREVVPKELKPNGRHLKRRDRITRWYDESLSRKLFCPNCKREFIGRTSNGFSYHVEDHCDGPASDLVFMD